MSPQPQKSAVPVGFVGRGCPTSQKDVECFRRRQSSSHQHRLRLHRQSRSLPKVPLVPEFPQQRTPSIDPNNRLSTPPPKTIGHQPQHPLRNHAPLSTVKPRSTGRYYSIFTFTVPGRLARTWNGVVEDWLAVDTYALGIARLVGEGKVWAVVEGRRSWRICERLEWRNKRSRRGKERKKGLGKFVIATG